jgi:hypothetical protein
MTKLITILIIGYSTLGIAQKIDTADSLNSLIVYGDGFTFGIKEPIGWKGDIANAAKYKSNIVFYLNESELANGGALIQAYAFSKHDENTIEDLNHDVSSYRKDYPKLKEQNLKTHHKYYKTFSKLVYLDTEFFQYITYINPGKDFHNGISVAMNIIKRPATNKELTAYKYVVSSLKMFK